MQRCHVDRLLVVKSIEAFHDPCQRITAAPYLERAKGELEGTRFESLLSPTCQQAQLSGLARALWAYAEDVVNRLVSAKLAQANPLWGIDARIAPSAQVAQARAELARAMESSGNSLLDESAPLLRAELDRQIDRFVAVTLETCNRIWADRQVIAARFLDNATGEGIGLVTALDGSLADRHNGGRHTTVVTCEAGRFVYKPHDCRIDLWFKRVAETYVPGTLAQPETIIRKDATGIWAFQEYLERVPVEDEAGLARYWHNMGRAGALFQALGSEDLHAENFVAVGDRPALVDCEMVLTGESAKLGDPLMSPNLGYASQGFGRDIADTLYTSALLPSPVWPIMHDDIRELAPIDNTSPLLSHSKACLPLLACVEHDVLGYEDEFLAGLEEGLTMLAHEADSLAADVKAAADIPVRRLIRDTNFYALLLARLRRVDTYEPTARKHLLDALHKPFARGRDGAPSPLAASEAASLVEGDVPYFTAAAGSRRVVGADGTSDDRLLEASAIELALSRIAVLDDPHNGFAHAVVEANLRRAFVPSENEVPACEVGFESLAADEALAEAARVFATLERLAVTSPSGEESWLFRSIDRGNLGSSTVAMGNGLGGVALFLSSFATHTTNPLVRDRALDLLTGCLQRIDEVVKVLETARFVPEASIGLGLTDGIGGIVRSLDLAARSLDGSADRCAATAKLAHKLLGRTLAVLGKVDIEHARGIDTYGGAAGLLLSLAQCPQAKRNEHSREVAHRLVRRILDARKPESDSAASFWDTLGTGWPVSGFGHGQAGIAAALALSQRAFGIEEVGGVCEPLIWELSAYSEKLDTWPDLRKSPVSSKIMHGICSGAPGIGLAALAVLRASADGQERALAGELLARADHACSTLPLNHRDTLCCGNGSLVEYLLTRGGSNEAGRVLAGMVARMREVGQYVFVHRGVRLSDEPDFLNGLAGVGYELLRFADPALPGVFVD